MGQFTSFLQSVSAAVTWLPACRLWHWSTSFLQTFMYNELYIYSIRKDTWTKVDINKIKIPKHLIDASRSSSRASPGTRRVRSSTQRRNTRLQSSARLIRKPKTRRFCQRSKLFLSSRATCNLSYPWQMGCILTNWCSKLLTTELNIFMCCRLASVVPLQFMGKKSGTWLQASKELVWMGDKQTRTKRVYLNVFLSKWASAFYITGDKEVNWYIKAIQGTLKLSDAKLLLQQNRGMHT